MEAAVSRVAWRQLEAMNAVTYLAQECREAYKELGLRGYWMGYFAGRAAPMGIVSAGVVEAAFFNFHPAMVRRALPDAWNFATPEAVLSARSLAAAAAIRRLVPHADELSRELLPLLTRAIDHGRGAGRPLFAANRDIASSIGGLAGLWQAATTLREHRGDGHVAILTETDLDGCEAHVLYAVTEGVAPEVLRDFRGWSATDWEQATDRLRHRGLLGSAGQPTDAGRQLRGHIERRTDELAVRPYEALGDDEMDSLLRISRRIANPIVSSGEIPFPNPMGLPHPNAAE